MLCGPFGESGGVVPLPVLLLSTDAGPLVVPGGPTVGARGDNCTEVGGGGNEAVLMTGV